MTTRRLRGITGFGDGSEREALFPRDPLPVVIPAVGALVLLGLVVALGPVRTLLLLAAVAVAVAVLRWFPELFLVAIVAAGPFAQAPVLSSVPGVVPLSFAGLLAAMGLAWWSRRGEPVDIPHPVWPFAFLVLLVIAGSLYSADPSGGFSKSVTFQTLSVLAFIAPLVLVRDRASLRRLLLGFAGIGLVAALVAVDGDNASRPLVLPGSDNEIALGLITGLGLVSLIAYFWPIVPGWWRLGLLIPVYPVLTTVLGAGSRGALLGTLAALIVAVISLLAAVPSSRRAMGGLLALFVLAAPILWVSTPEDARDKYADTLRNAREGGGAQAGGEERAGFAGAAYELFRDNPMGVGTNGFPGVTGLQYPHNIVLELGSELGVIGIAVFAWLVIAVVTGIVRKVQSGDCQIEAIAVLALLIVPLVLAMSSFDLNQNRALWLMLGLGTAVASLRDTVPRGDDTPAAEEPAEADRQEEHV